MTADQVIQFLDSHQRAYAAGDAWGVAAHYAESCVVESPLGGALVAGRSAVEDVARRTFTAFPDFAIEQQDLLISGDRAVQTATVVGTDTGGFLGAAPTGRPFRVPSVFVFTLAAHEIVHECRSYDFSGFLLQLAGQAGPSVASAQRYRDMLERGQLERDIRTAADVQRALLPPLRHHGGGFDLVGSSTPCRVIGGDFFDYFELDNGDFGIALGDMSGKGAPAALLTARLQGMFDTHSRASRSPADIMTRVNRALARRSVDSRFATAIYGVLSRDGRFTYCNAGHNEPMLLRGHRVRRLRAGGLILGAFPDARFDEQTIQLQPGDVIVAFSDGLTDAANGAGDAFGDERLATCVRATRHLDPNDILEQVFAAVHAFTSTAAQLDDMTALALRYTGQERQRLNRRKPPSDHTEVA